EVEWSLVTSDVQYVAKTASRDEADLCTGALEHGGCRNGRAVEDHAEVTEPERRLGAGALHRVDNAARDVRRSARHLVHDQPAVVGDEKHVGERTPDVNPD